MKLLYMSSQSQSFWDSIPVPISSYNLTLQSIGRIILIHINIPQQNNQSHYQRIHNPIIIAQIILLPAQKNMTYPTISIILLSTIIATHTLHLPHQASDITALKNIQNALLTHSQSIHTAFEQNNPQSLGSRSIDDKIRILEDLLLAQRTQLLQLIKQSQYNLNSTQSTCQPFSPIAKMHLQHAYSNIKLKYKQLHSYLLSNASIAAYKSTIDISQQVNNYISSRQSAYFSTNKQYSSGAAHTKKMTNFNAGMWALGKITANNLNQLLSKQPSAELCPFHIPFADREGRCQQCPKQRPYFILQGQSCFSCFTYNIDRRQCLDERGNIVAGTVLFTNYAAAKDRILLHQNQSILQFTTNTQNLPLCSPNMPFFNGKQCIDCPKEQYFSPSQLACRSCPSDYYYEPTSMTCKRVSYYSRAEFLSWSTQLRSIDDVLQEISVKKSSISYRACPQKTPFSIKSECIGCAKPTHFSYDSLKCQSCPQKTILNLNMHRCVKIANLNYQTNPVSAPNLIVKGRSLNQWASNYYTNINNQPGISDCPKETPYFDAIACITCPKSHPYFNLQKLVCQYCQGPTIYDAQQRECIQSIQHRAVQVPTWQKMAAAVFS